MLREGSRSQKRKTEAAKESVVEYLHSQPWSLSKVGLIHRTHVVDCISCASGQIARKETGPSRRMFTPKSERCSTAVDSH